MKIANELELASLRREIQDLIGKILQVSSMTQRDIAAKLHTNEFRLGRLLAGDIRRPKLQEKQILLGILNQAQGGAPAPIKSVTIQPGNIKLPIFACLPSADENQIGEVTFPAWVLGGECADCFILRVHGNQSAPILNQGDLVVVRQNTPCTSEDFVAVRVDGFYALDRLAKVRVQKELQVVGKVILVMRAP